MNATDRMTIAEVCDRMRLSRWTVKRLVDAHELDVEREGRNVWIPARSYRAFLDRNTVPTQTQNQRTEP